jgi:hypothetical protein
MISWRPLQIVDGEGKIGFLWTNRAGDDTMIVITDSPNHPPVDETRSGPWVLAYERVESGTVEPFAETRDKARAAAEMK